MFCRSEPRAQVSGLALPLPHTAVPAGTDALPIYGDLIVAQKYLRYCPFASNQFFDLLLLLDRMLSSTSLFLSIGLRVGSLASKAMRLE